MTTVARPRHRIHLLIVALLAAQYAVFQLATGAQYWDAPRNLHWGLFTSEEPRFLLGSEDVYDRINGYPPDPASLAPAGAAQGRSTPLHTWWGPLYPLVFAALWRLTGSYTLLALVVPACAAALVALTYAAGRQLFGATAGLIAAVLLAVFPSFREHAVMGFVEPISALLLLGAFWAFLARRYALAGLIGTLAVLGKLDMIPLYLGGVAGTIALGWRSDGPERPTPRQIALALGLPALAAIAWRVLTYGVLGRPATVAGGPNLEVLQILVPQVLVQIFLLPIGPTLVILGLIAAPACYALLRPGAAPAKVYRLLGLWLALGLAVMLVYMAMPGASNNPRVFIPALPALCLLTADGLARMRPRPRILLLTPVLTVLLLSSAIGMAFQSAQAAVLRLKDPVWATLREAPHGAVMTEDYWQAALYARQPATWFCWDEEFQGNILGDREHMRRYLAVAPIRYIVLAADEEAEIDRLAALPAVRFYNRIPLRRDLGLRKERLTAPAVRAYLDATYPKQRVGEYVIFTLR